MGIDERGKSLNQFNVVAFQLVRDDIQFVFDDLVLPRHEVAERQALLQGIGDVGKRAELEPMQVEDRVLERLARERAGIDARAADDRLLLDDGDTLAELGRLDSRLLPSRPAPY